MTKDEEARLHIWEKVNTASFPNLWRVRVPNGWLYSYRGYTEAPLTFVPDRIP